tara:strand:- start:1026 stop:1385 length:360 start_codon:yes stop_codon:yes gene_type:complete
MELNKYLHEFITNFVMGGTIIGIYSLVIKFLSAALAGHASGALPLVFTYVTIKTYNLFGYEEAKRVSRLGFIGGFFWLSYSFIVYMMLKYNQNIVLSISTAIVLFFIINYIYYRLLNRK